MNCVRCGKETEVVDSRSTTGGARRRRRECRSCNAKFSTIELEYTPRKGVTPNADPILARFREVSKLMPAIRVLFETMANALEPMEEGEE